MAKQQCRAPGCGARTSRYGRFCPTHRSRSRRHGHPEQAAITKADLTPFLRLVRARVAKNKSSPIWALCTDRWLALVDHARRLSGASALGQASYRCERIAAQEAIKLADHVEPVSIWETAFSMYLMEDQQSRRFRSDASFRMQLVRRLRGLTDLNAGTWFNHRTGKVQRAYREVTPRAALVLAGWIVEALGGMGLHLAKLEHQDQQTRQLQANCLAEALKALR